jgi:hypothetical protein
MSGKYEGDYSSGMACLWLAFIESDVLEIMLENSASYEKYCKEKLTPKIQL